ncbi:hypothetical protein PP304_gp071 [Gordonia phage Phendrix]|uniref:Uncharacterized protein n=2 Tax=Godonkavirus TaxID=2733178 RepID=A0A4D6E2F4_9CAUD|nr:hypothetical protein HOV33_gp072 [Gordonia phage GodonK]YP_010649115.1 hypothetical protein PP304_gp071 [Gordonia phage Phendrix]QBZ72691.1 hypothetical protein SEA_GODONK_72 [Gordonia phage GodonK]QDK02619.1 hypothetical protein SEA_PHENDRIX_71 [Gordonia phage Phendrix]
MKLDEDDALLQELEVVIENNMWLGNVLSVEDDHAVCEYGAIYWSSCGVFALPIKILDVYAENAYESGPLGYPTGPREFTQSGIKQPFQGGMVHRDKDQRGTIEWSKNA